MFIISGLFGFIIWLLFCILVGKCASRWNRSFGIFFILSIIFSPLIMGIILLIMGKKESSYSSKNTNYSNTSSSMYGKSSFNSGATWTCQKCGDKNSISNSYCKGCGEYKPLGVGANENKNPTPIVINEGNEWTCKKCNEKNPLTATNCKSCGAYK
jgi:ribosomal protein L40E